MYVLVETNEASKTSNSYTFSELEDLAAWAHERLPSKKAEVSPSVLARAHEVIAMLQSVIVKATETVKELEGSGADECTRIADLEGPTEADAQEDAEDSDSEDEAPATSIPTVNRYKHIADSQRIEAIGKERAMFFQRAANGDNLIAAAVDKSKEQQMETLIPDITRMDYTDVEFGMDMHRWYADTTMHDRSTTIQYSAVSDARDKIIAIFRDTFCCNVPFGIYSFDSHGRVTSTTIYKFVWVLALNFPTMFFKSCSDISRSTVDHGITILKIWKGGMAGETLATYYNVTLRDTDTRDLGLRMKVCYDLLMVLSRLKSTVKPQSNFLDTKEYEIFLFKTLFYYYKNDCAISQTILGAWVAVFLHLKTVKMTEGSIQSSELLTQFGDFVREVLTIVETDRPTNNEDILGRKGTFPFDANVFRDQLLAFLTTKTFSRAMKHNNIASQRKSAGVFYTGITSGSGVHLDSADAGTQIVDYNEYDCMWASVPEHRPLYETNTAVPDVKAPHEFFAVPK